MRPPRRRGLSGASCSLPRPIHFDQTASLFCWAMSRVSEGRTWLFALRNSAVESLSYAALPFVSSKVNLVTHRHRADLLPSRVYHVLIGERLPSNISRKLIVATQASRQTEVQQ